MNRHVALFLLCASALWLAGCHDTLSEYCPRYYAPRTSYDFKLPSGSYGGLTVGLGEYNIKPEQFQTVNEALIAIDQGRWYSCVALHDPITAQNKERVASLEQKMDDCETKLEQLADILVKYPAAKKDAAAPADASKPAAAQAAAGLSEDLGKWVDSYGKKTALQQATAAPEPSAATSMALSPQNIQQANSMDAAILPAASAAGPRPATAAVVTPRKRATIQALLAVPPKPNDYFGLPPRAAASR